MKTSGRYELLVPARKCAVIATRQISPEVELVRWILFVLAAITLIPAIAEALAPL